MYRLLRGILELALERETIEKATYHWAAERVSDEPAKAALLALAEEREEQVRVIKRKYTLYGGSPHHKYRLKPTDLEPLEGLAPDDIHGLVRHLQQRERACEVQCRLFARTVDNLAVREFLLYLAELEQKHFTKAQQLAQMAAEKWPAYAAAPTVDASAS
jgi:hypothetical protein